MVSYWTYDTLPSVIVHEKLWNIMLFHSNYDWTCNFTIKLKNENLRTFWNDIIAYFDTDSYINRTIDEVETLFKEDASLDEIEAVVLVRDEPLHTVQIKPGSCSNQRVKFNLK